MGILDELKQSANLKVYHDARRGSLLDYSGNGLTLTPSGTGHRFIRTPKGTAFCGGLGTTEYNAGVQASLDLTTATMFYVCHREHTSYQYMISKYDFAGAKGYLAYWDVAITLLLTDAASTTQSIVITAAPYLHMPTLVCHTWNGTNVVTYANGKQIDLVAQTKIPAPATGAYRIGRSPMLSGFLLGGMANIVLTGAEVARLYDDFLAEGPSPDLIRRNFVQVPQTYGSKDADYFSNVSTLVNGDFETGDPPTGWNSGVLNGTISRVAGARPGGTGSYVGQATNVAATLAYWGFIKPTYLAVGAVYRATGWCRVANAAANYFPFIQNSLSVRYWEGQANTSAWQYFDFTFTAATVELYLYAQDSAKTPGNWVQYDDVQVFPLACCLDTDFVRGPDGKIRDNGPNNYAGTVTGTPMPDGEGIHLKYASDNVAFGDVTQLNSASQFSLETWLKSGPGNIEEHLAIKYLNGANSVRWGCYNTASTSMFVHLNMFTAGVTKAAFTTARVLRSGATQHVISTFNAGTPVTYVDGEAYPLTVDAGYPVVTPNLAGASLSCGTSPLESTRQGMRVFTKALTAAEVRQAYLKNFAQKILLRETFEDVPVSLGVSATAGMYIGGWRVVAGSAQCTETANGNRYLTTIASASSGVAIPSKQAFGTWRFRFRTTNVSQESTINFIANVEGNYGAAGQASYAFYCASQFYLLRGGAIAFLATVPLATVTPQNDTEYEIVIARRPSDCQFKMWMKGGTLAQWTLVATATDATYLTSNWFNVFSTTVSSTCSLAMAPYSLPSAGVTMYQGQLSPVDGEIP